VAYQKVQSNGEPAAGVWRTIMKTLDRVRMLTLLAAILGVSFFVVPSAAQTNAPEPQYPALPSETPAKFEPVTEGFD